MNFREQKAIVEQTKNACIAIVQDMVDHWEECEHDPSDLEGFACSIVDSIETIEPDTEADNNKWGK